MTASMRLIRLAALRDPGLEVQATVSIVRLNLSQACWEKCVSHIARGLRARGLPGEAAAGLPNPVAHRIGRTRWDKRGSRVPHRASWDHDHRDPAE